VIVRETNAEAWKAADELIQYVTDETVASAQKISPHGLGRPAAHGAIARRSAATSSRSARTSGPVSVWYAAGQAPPWSAIRDRGSTYREYQDVGIDTFIMSGYPHLEEAYRFAFRCSRWRSRTM